MTPRDPLGSLFLGVGGEGIDTLRLLFQRVLDEQRRFRLGAFPGTPPAGAPGAVVGAGPEEAIPADVARAVEALLARLASNPPYFHPRYAAQMIKDPAIPSIVGYLAAMLINPNNHAYEGGPATTEMELEVVDDLLRLVGFEEAGRAAGWGHLCSGGSLANLEALWAARDTRPDGPVVFSRMAHYNWKRGAAILRIPRVVEAEIDDAFRLDVGHLEQICRRERPVMVVANLGTTGVGAVDPLEAMLDLRDRHGFHLHVDAAYGGYARACLRSADGALLAHESVAAGSGMSEYVYRQFAALGRADSVTIDPHKHGLAPYGAGSVLYRSAAMRKPLLNSAPYTYHLADRPNLGTISLEGSRPGAAAAACWLTHRLVPLDARGFGAIVGAGMRVARTFHARAVRAPLARPLHEPDLDILCVARLPGGRAGGAAASLAEIDRASAAVYDRLSVAAPGPKRALISRFSVPGDVAARIFPGARADVESFGALRMVFMKHWLALPENREVLEEMARAVLEE